MNSRLFLARMGLGSLFFSTRPYSMSTAPRSRRQNRPSRQDSRSRNPGEDGQPRRRSSSRNRDRQEVPESFPRPVRRPTFLQRILAFFGIGKATAKPRDRRPGASPKTRRESPVRKQRQQSVEEKPKRPPEVIEVTSPRLFVGNLSYDTTESDLIDLFKGFGDVQQVEIVSHRQTQRSKGFAFVEMLAVTEAKRAVEELHNQPFMGRKLIVSGAKSDGAR
ncbi:hypothetical protein BH23VER1_BH23VER1_22210 [soil metagenome]